MKYEINITPFYDNHSIFKRVVQNHFCPKIFGLQMNYGLKNVGPMACPSLIKLKEKIYFCQKMFLFWRYMVVNENIMKKEEQCYARIHKFCVDLVAHAIKS